MCLAEDVPVDKKKNGERQQQEGSPPGAKLGGNNGGNNTSSPVNTSLQLNSLRKAIPEQAFQKVAWKSVAYMLFDYLVWGSALYTIASLRNSNQWTTLPFYQQALITFTFWNVAGFYMWCIFVIGHDCGHSTFSTSELFNDIIGHITHGSIMVPYYPWRLSHRRHHMHHNHIDKDYSHPWYTSERLQKDDEHMARMLHSRGLGDFIRGLFPYFGFAVYLYGMPDGSHFIPFPGQRMWKESTQSEKIKCIISCINCIVWATIIYYACGQNLYEVGYYFGIPWMYFSWWLVSVTYLQHHDPTTFVYGDEDWKFVDAGFETVDRTYGFGIDWLHHHITDGHVAHHLFFTSIPHYNLPIATKAIREYLNEHNMGFMYKSDSTWDFIYRTHQYIWTNGFMSHRAPIGGGPLGVYKARNDLLVEMNTKKSN